MEQDKRSKSLLQPTNMNPVSNQQHTLPRKKTALYIYNVYIICYVYNYIYIYIYSNKSDQTKNNMDILHCLQLYFFGNPKFPREDGPVLEPSTGLRLTQCHAGFFGGDGWQTELFVYFSSLAML
jgi:hypothetical protein